MNLIDSHCHLTAPEILPKLDEHIQAARKVGVTGFILPGVSQEDWQLHLQLADNHQGVFPAAGLHPLYLETHRKEHLIELESLSQNNQIVAVGEIGLDFYYGRDDETAQRGFFLDQLDIAKACNLPVILHVRKAHDQILAMLRKKHFPCGGVVHAFSGSLQQAHQYIDLGFAIGIGGAISHDRALKRRQVAAAIPAQSIVLETDSPDMQLAGKKNLPNLPQYLIEVMQILATLRQEPEDVLAQQTYGNTLNIFHLHGWEKG